ncbi:MAG: hypothetical protein L0H79_20275 [Intrasporangium sp.]|uniref:hypothetical protein n=1 Tax=Intrasporangium sp. TaxID=1925024 RepID=UPI002648DE83|nr:hypothetical protein [Intrasporangium sp.]MDN5798062.1 hypothetical protein [Intrasporangium sp.]
MTRVDPHWLDLRGPADVRARTDSATGLADELARWLHRRRPAGPVRLVDVGAGTGAGATWLRHHLAHLLPPARQNWRLVDHDPDLLVRAQPVSQAWATPEIADLTRLAGLLAEEPTDAVTCQALLDLLTAGECRALLEPAVAHRAAVLAGLTVTGWVDLQPGHPADELVGEAFNAHQRRAGRLGPAAGDLAAETLRDQGYTVTAAATPWRLRGPDRELTDAWLRGRAEAATEQRPRDAARIEGWLADRLQAARHGRLEAVVGHVDLLGLPPDGSLTSNAVVRTQQVG